MMSLLMKRFKKASLNLFYPFSFYRTSTALNKQSEHTSQHFYPTHIEHLASLNVSGSGIKWNLLGIVATIGPASKNVETLVEMMECGMTIARLNMAHGSHEQHLQIIHNIRQANYIYAEREQRSTLIAIAIDLQGPTIRTGLIGGGQKEVKLISGNEITLSTNKEHSENVTGSVVYVDYKKITSIVHPGYSIFIDDGHVELKVIKIEGEYIKCKIEHGGKLGNSKGINLPGIEIDLPPLSEKDKRDIAFALENKIDMVFASFVRDKTGVEDIRKLIDIGDRAFQMSLIAKIENQQGVANADEILEAADGLMVARGDLGIELPVEKIFIAQKSLIAKCNLVGKPVICATQMLNSMINKPRPTRAETSDIANAVLDGSDCLMLSAESAIGKYPVECVKEMTKVCKEAEAAVPHKQLFIDLSKMVHPPTSDPVSTVIAAVTAAEKVMARAILTNTTTGASGLLISKFRPACPIIVITRNAMVARKCQLYRGVFPVLHAGEELSEWSQDVEFRLKSGLMTAHQMGFVNKDDRVILLVGWKAGRGSTNTMKIVQITQEMLQ